MRQTLFRLLMSLLMVLGLGAASIVHASGPCVPEVQTHVLTPTLLSDCAQGSLRTGQGSIPCGKMRLGCIALASCYSNTGLAAPEIALPIHCRTDVAPGTMRSALLEGIAIPPLLHPPAFAS